MQRSALAVAALLGVFLALLSATSSDAALNACAVGKKKCVAKKVAALLKCHIKAESPPKGLAVADLAKCIQTAKDKFDGGSDQTKGCFAKLEKKYGAACLTANDTAAYESKVDAFVDDAVCGLDPSTCPVPTCGNDVREGTEVCDGTDATACPGNCKPDCTCNDPCAGHVYYAGKYDGASSVWADLPAAAGMTGLDAGNAQCQTLGADHVCDYEEVLTAAVQSQLGAIPQGTTAWIQRTTVATVFGLPSPPGTGGRCVDWTFNGNHLADGEYATFDTAGVPTMHLDNDTFYDPNAPNQHTIAGDLECGGTTRSILCCFASCAP